MKQPFKVLFRLILVCGIGYVLFLATGIHIYCKADSLYEKLVTDEPKTKADVDEILSSRKQVSIPMSESPGVLGPNESCVQYRVCGLASWPIDVIYADGTNVVHIYQTYD